MEDRLIDLQQDIKKLIRKRGYGWFVEDDNSEYVADHIMLISKQESEAYLDIAEECYALYQKALDYVHENDLWGKLGLPSEIIPLIKLDMQRDLPLICGRLDLAGGIEGIPIKLIEFNADTSTILPESAYFQRWINELENPKLKKQTNFLIQDLTRNFKKLKKQFRHKIPTLLLTSLGHEEDQLNLNVISDAAQAAGFEVDYADLEDVVFSEDGVFLEHEGSYVEYHFMYKLVPWEFIMFEEPELLRILTELSMNKGLIVLNPAYSIALQAKHMLSILYELFPDKDFLLPTFDEPTPLRGKSYAKKVNFGRQGENIEIVSNTGHTIEQTDGDFGSFTKVYQEFAEMYKDEDGDIYQAGVYLSNGFGNCISFRRRDSMIIDEDAEFVSHVLF